MRMKGISAMLLKIIITIVIQIKNRGFLIAFLMNSAHLIGILRGLFYKLLYFRNIKCTVYALESRSKIEIFNKRATVNIGKFVFIRNNSRIRVDSNGLLDIAEKVFINDNCNINCAYKITIGENTKIAPNVCINDHDHDYKNVTGNRLIKGEVVIGKNVWIGSNVVILRDTIIGDQAVIAAGSIVKGYVPANTLFFNKRDNQYIPYRISEQRDEMVVNMMK